MELRYGALHNGWGELRRRRLDRRIAELAVVQPDEEMVTVCAEFAIAGRSGMPLAISAGDESPGQAVRCERIGAD